MSKAQKKKWEKSDYKNMMSKNHKGKHSSPTTEFKKGNVPSHKGKKLLAATRENHWNWQDGKSFEQYPEEFNKELKNLIRNRDGYFCRLCGRNEDGMKQKLHVHHVDYDKQNCKKENLILLCRKCHLRTNWNRDSWKKYFERANVKNRKIYWLTGASGSGKTTLAQGIQKSLTNCIILDGDELRGAISRDLGFSPEDRETHNLRVATLASILEQQGFLVIVSVIAPMRRIRQKISTLIHPKWIYVKRTLPEREGHFYEEPTDYFFVDHDILTVAESTKKVLNEI